MGAAAGSGAKGRDARYSGNPSTLGEYTFVPVCASLHDTGYSRSRIAIHNPRPQHMVFQVFHLTRHMFS